MSTFSKRRRPYISNSQFRHLTNKMKESLRKRREREQLNMLLVETIHFKINRVRAHSKAAMRGRMKWFRNKNHLNSIMQAVKNRRTMQRKRKNRYFSLTFSCCKTSFETEILRLTTKIKKMRVRHQKTNLQKNKKSNRLHQTKLDRIFRAT